MTLRVLIVDDETIMRMDLAEIVKGAGYEVVSEAKDGLEAIQLSEELNPDIVLMDIKMPLLDGLTACKRILTNKHATSVLLLTAYSDKDFVAAARNAGAHGYLIKPIDEHDLIPAIELAVANGKTHQHLDYELDKLKTQLEDRKYIDRAKGLLMETKNLTENEAYKELRSLAMTRRISISELAKILIGE